MKGDFTSLFTPPKKTMKSQVTRSDFKNISDGKIKNTMKGSKNEKVLGVEIRILGA